MQSVILDISHPQTRTKNVISRRLSLKLMAAQLALRSTLANLARWLLMPFSQLPEPTCSWMTSRYITVGEPD